MTPFNAWPLLALPVLAFVIGAAYLALFMAEWRPLVTAAMVGILGHAAAERQLDLHTHTCASPLRRWEPHAWECAALACAGRGEKVCPLHGHQ